MSEWRCAWCVELYDAQVMVRRDLHSGGFSEYDFPGFRVSGDTVHQFVEHLGIIPQTATGGSKGQQGQVKLRGSEFVIRRELDWYGDDYQLKVSALRARVSGPHLLDLRITVRNPGGEEWTTEHTYCGAFAVEWEAEKGE
jgi:hypothetical protein